MFKNKSINPKQIYELAEELNTTSKRIMEKLSDVNIFKKSHMSYLTPEELKILYKHIGIPVEDDISISELNKKTGPRRDISRPRIIRTTLITKQDNGQKDIIQSSNSKNISKIINDIYDSSRNKNSVNISQKVQMIYNAIELTRKEYGDFKKCEMHLHTPASHDYVLHNNLRNNEGQNNGEYYKASIENIMGLPEIKEIYSIEEINKINDNLEYYNGKEYSQYLKTENIPFSSFREEAAYMLLAHALYKNKISLALITDHNTINGFNKLKYAVKEYYKLQEGIIKHFVDVFLGIEISCSDGNHVVGIFDDTNYKIVETFIDEIISNKKDGTYYPSLYIIERIFKLGGIGYIAHINSSPFNGNKPYKERLFNIPEMRIIGLTDKESKQDQTERINNYVNLNDKEFCFIQESDAHTIDDIGKRNTWIKFSNINFKALKKAIEDHGICIRMEEPSKSNKYIKGIVVSPGDSGFLMINKDNKQKYSGNEFFVEFSQDLNCIIGGRGTGKSTLVNIIDLCFSQQIDDVNLLNFISKNDEIVIVFCLKDIDYVLRLIPQVELINEDNSVKYFKDAFDTPFYSKKELFKLSDNWYEFYQVKRENGENIFKKINGNRIISEFYRRGYSINSLVNKIRNKTISEYIRSIVLYGLEYKNIGKEVINIKSTGDDKIEKYLSRSLHRIQKFIQEQTKIVTDTILGFNKIYKNQLQITYTVNRNKGDEIIEILSKDQSNREGERFIAKTYLQWNEVLVYLRLIIDKIGYLEFLNLLLNKKYFVLEQHLKMSDFVDQNKISQWMIENGFSDINTENINNVYDEIKRKLVTQSGFLRNSVIYWIQSREEFSLMFNVNNKETIKKTEVLFKDLHELSMGQKVSALLSFVFNYGKYTSDNTPLIIDQPEDNLDNQYIYRNLIKSLRDIKNERQVIIVTIALQLLQTQMPNM